MNLIINKKRILSKISQLALVPFCVAIFFIAEIIINKVQYTTSVGYIMATSCVLYSVIFLFLLISCSKKILVFNKIISFVFVFISFMVTINFPLKTNVVLFVVFSIFLYYTHWSLSEFTGLPIFNPQFDLSNIHPPKSFDLSFKVNEREVILMNWDNKQAFFYAKDAVVNNTDVLKFSVKVNNRLFELEGEVVSTSSSGNGFGVVFNNQSEMVWVDLVEYLNVRGIVDTRMR